MAALFKSIGMDPSDALTGKKKRKAKAAERAAKVGAFRDAKIDIYSDDRKEKVRDHFFLKCSSICAFCACLYM